MLAVRRPFSPFIFKMYYCKAESQQVVPVCTSCLKSCHFKAVDVWWDIFIHSHPLTPTVATFTQHLVLDLQNTMQSYKWIWQYLNSFNFIIFLSDEPDERSIKTIMLIIISAISGRYFGCLKT